MIELQVHLQSGDQPDPRLKNHSNSLENPWEQLNIQQNISPVTARRPLNLGHVKNVWEKLHSAKMRQIAAKGKLPKKMKYDLKVLVN